MTLHMYNQLIFLRVLTNRPWFYPWISPIRDSANISWASTIWPNWSRCSDTYVNKWTKIFALKELTLYSSSSWTEIHHSQPVSLHLFIKQSLSTNMCQKHFLALMNQRQIKYSKSPATVRKLFYIFKGNFLYNWPWVFSSP